MKLGLAAGQPAVLVSVPAGAKTKRDGHRLQADGVTIDFRAAGWPEDAPAATVPRATGFEHHTSGSP